MQVKNTPRMIILALLAILLIPALSATTAIAEQNPDDKSATAEAEKSTAQSFVVGPEDIIEVSVWKNPDLSKVVTVRPDGRISLPLIGDIKAAGLTPEEIRDVIVARLEKYQSSVVVSVIVQEVNSYRVFIVGEVKSPGTYRLKARTSVLQAIAIAGGFSQFADRNKIVLIRDNTAGDRVVEKLNVRFDDILKKDFMSDNNMILKSGDTIIVP